MSCKNRKKIKLPSSQPSISVVAMASSQMATVHKQPAEGKYGEVYISGVMMWLSVEWWCGHRWNGGVSIGGVVVWPSAEWWCKGPLKCLWVISP